MVEIVVDYLGKLVIIFLGELDGLLYALVIFVVLDYITGICAAIQAKHLSSNIGAKGIAKKVAIFLVISVAHVADQYLVDSTDVLRSMTTLFYLSNEGISIFENIGKIGIPLPGKLNNLLSSMLETGMGRIGLTSLPFLTTMPTAWFASEETICTHYYQLIRSNLKSFINGKLISSLLSSILIVLSSTFIYTLTMILTGHPIGDGRFSYEGTNLLLLKHLVENNHYWLHYMCHILVFSVIATLSPWISLIASTFTKNRYIIFLAPFVVIRFLDVFGDLTGYFWIKPSHYRLSGTNIYELGMLGTFLYAFCFLAICQLIYRYCIRRKLRNG